MLILHAINHSFFAKFGENLFFIRGLRVSEPVLIVKKLGVLIKDLCVDVVDVMPIRPPMAHCHMGTK